MKKTKLLTTAVILTFALTVSSCSLVNKFIQKSNAEYDEKYQKIVDKKADDYGIDPEGVVVSEGGTYFRVPIDTIRTYEDYEEHIIRIRKWLRFAYAEFGKRYSVQFYDNEYPDVWYAGFSEDRFFDSEYYWSDERILESLISRIHLMANIDDRYSETTPEEYYEISGIDAEKEKEFQHRFSETYPKFKDIVPDKDEHDYTFIPGDTINHCEKFIIGDKDCDIEAGTYEVDLPNDYGIIHVTDEDDETKYRMDASYKDGHYDELYTYESLPAVIELEDGDIIYITNCTATFDLID